MNISGWNGNDEDLHCKGSFVQWPLDNTRHVDETKMTDGNGDQSDGKTQTTKKGKRRNKQDKEENEIGESDGEMQRTKKGKRKKKQDKENNDPMIDLFTEIFSQSQTQMARIVRVSMRVKGILRWTICPYHKHFCYV